MSYYYYPLCTKDFTFENIFATESVSPPIFYSKRGFGIDYFYKIPKVHDERAIVLFEKPPIYETGSDNSNILKFMLAIDKGCLEPTETLSIDRGIIGYKKTIYFDKKNFKVLFFSETDKRVVCLRSETSLPTKALGKYFNNIELIAESDCAKFDFSGIEQLSIEDESINDAIFYDRLYNTFKGFVYGAAAGLIDEKSKGEVKLKRSFQEIANCFSELRNRRDTDQKGMGTRYAKTFGVGQSSPVKLFYDKLIHAIAISEKQFYDLYPPQVISEEDMAKYLLSIKDQRLKTLEEATRYVSYRILDDELLGTNSFQQLKARYQKETGKRDPSTYYNSLKELAEKCMYGSTASDWNSDKKGNVNIANDFKMAVNEIAKFFELKSALGRVTKKINFEAVEYNSEKNQIVIGPGFGDLQDHEREEYQMIINVILKNPKFGKGEAKKETILKIVEETGERTNKINGGKQTRLYKYLNNEVNDYSIEKATSIVMKNFISFIFNIDSVESLENYTEVKEIDSKWMATSFWCLFNGFANTSGIFLNNIFAIDNEGLQNQIDHYLKQSFPRIVVEMDSLENMTVMESPAPLYKVENEKKGEGTNKLEEFYNKYVKGKFDIDLEKFISIFQKTNTGEILQELKNQHKVLKKDGKVLIELFKDEVSQGTLTS